LERAATDPWNRFYPSACNNRKRRETKKPDGRGAVRLSLFF
jgi:hypothetical protein